MQSRPVETSARPGVAVTAFGEVVVNNMAMPGGVVKALDWLSEHLACDSVRVRLRDDVDGTTDFHHVVETVRNHGRDPYLMSADGVDVLTVPLWQGDAILGCVEMRRVEGLPFSASEMELVGLLAPQLTAFVVHDQLLFATWAQTSELMSLYGAVTAVGNVELTLANVGRVVLERFLQTLGLHSGLLVLWDRHLDRLVLNLWLVDGQAQMPNPDYDARLVGNAFLSRQMGERHPQLITRSQRTADKDVDELLDLLGFAQVMVVPLYGQREAKGVALLLCDESAREFSSFDLGFAGTFAMHAANTIEQSHLFDQTKRSVEEMAVLHATALDLSSHVTLPALLKRVADRARRLVNAEACWILLTSPDLSGTGPVASYASSALADKDRILPDPAISSEVKASQRTIMAGPQSTPSDESAVPASRGSRVAVPMLADGEVLGILQVFAPGGERIYGQRDAELLEMLASQAAVSIRNARLFAELEHSMKQLSETQSRLLQAEKLASVGRMAAAVAHEVNNPLQSIQNCLHIALRKNIPADKRNDYLNMAVREVRRLTTTVRSLLEFYRPSQGDRDRINLESLIDDVLALTNLQLSDQRIEVRTNYTATAEIIGVRDHLHQVMLNLILNSMDAMPNGGLIRIEVGLASEREVAVILEDTGTGIPGELLPAIFEPFVTSKTRGTGLGLATSLSIVEAHGGQMKVTSEPGNGTSVTITLPLARPEGE